MIEINSQDNYVIIKPFDISVIPNVARLFNSGSDMRYATGIDTDVSMPELESIFSMVIAQEKSFIAGIYVKDRHKSSDITAMEHFAGICSGMICGGSIWFRHLSILPEFRRKGIGRKAAELVFDYFKNYHRIFYVYISVLEENAPGLMFWNKLGFDEVTSIKKVLFAEKLFHNVVIMKKEL